MKTETTIQKIRTELQRISKKKFQDSKVRTLIPKEVISTIKKYTDSFPKVYFLMFADIYCTCSNAIASQSASRMGLQLTEVEHYRDIARNTILKALAKFSLKVDNQIDFSNEMTNDAIEDKISDLLDIIEHYE